MDSRFHGNDGKSYVDVDAAIVLLWRRRSIKAAIERIAGEKAAVIVLLRDQESSRDFMDAVEGLGKTADDLEQRRGGESVLKTYGVGAQILRDLGLSKIRVLSAPKHMYAISGFDLEITEYVEE